MILTVTLNPLLERRLFYKGQLEGNDHRSAREVLTAGGKGINVHRQLNMLGVPCQSLTFAGGSNGKILRRLLAEENNDCIFIPTKSETRYASLAISESEKKTTTLFAPNSEILASEAEEFKSKLNKMIRNCSIVVFSGSSPSKFTEDIFTYGIQLAHEYDKTSILDTYGTHLKECLNQSPTVLHNNLDELEKSLGVDLSTEESITNMLDIFYGKGIKLAYITDGENPIYASKSDFHYRVEFPAIEQISSTGSGDSFTAGLVYGLDKALVFDEFTTTAASLGAANAARPDVCKVTGKEIENYAHKIKIYPIGKKMKLIDDSPNY